MGIKENVAEAEDLHLSAFVMANIKIAYTL